MRADNRPKALIDNHSRTYAEGQAVRLCLGLRANRREEPGHVECWHSAAATRNAVVVGPVSSPNGGTTSTSG